MYVQNQLLQLIPNFNNRIRIIVTLLVIATSAFTFSNPLFVNSTTPYDSGYDHGCDDAKISDPSDRYINQPEKGPSYHTSEFMDGYYRGFDICANDTDKENDNDNDNNRVESQESSSSSGLKITSSSSYRQGDYFYIVGEVLNTDSNDKEYVKVIATLYDDNRNVIGTGFTYTDPSTISSQESSPFKIIIGDIDVSSIDSIDSFKLVASDK